MSGWQGALAKPLHEMLGPPLLAAATLAWLVAWRRSRQLVALWLLAVAAVALAREINFEAGDLFLLVAAAALLAWALAARRELLASARTLPARGLLLAVPVCYALSNLVDLRPVRIATGGIGRVALEEPLETVGHAALLLGGVIAALAARRD